MIIIYSLHSVYSWLLHTKNKTIVKIGCVSLYILFKKKLKSSFVWLEGIEYIISKIPGSDNYENYPNIPNIDGQPRYQTSLRRSTDIFRGEKSNQRHRGLLSIRPPTIIKEHKRTITFGSWIFTFGTQPLEIYMLVENFQGKNHFEPVPMVGGIRLVVVMKGWQWVW